MFTYRKVQWCYQTIYILQKIDVVQEHFMMIDFSLQVEHRTVIVILINKYYFLKNIYKEKKLVKSN